MVAESPDEAVEGAAVRQWSIGIEATPRPQLGVVFQFPYEGVGVGTVEEEGGEVGPPHGLQGIALPSNGAVRLQPVQQGLVVHGPPTGQQLDYSGRLRRQTARATLGLGH